MRMPVSLVKVIEDVLRKRGRKVRIRTRKLIRRAEDLDQSLRKGPLSMKKIPPRKRLSHRREQMLSRHWSFLISRPQGKKNTWKREKNQKIKETKQLIRKSEKEIGLEINQKKQIKINQTLQEFRVKPQKLKKIILRNQRVFLQKGKNDLSQM
jgi:hypothetical protein